MIGDYSLGIEPRQLNSDSNLELLPLGRSSTIGANDGPSVLNHCKFVIDCQDSTSVQVDEEELKEEFVDQTKCVRQKIELCRPGDELRRAYDAETYHQFSRPDLDMS